MKILINSLAGGGAERQVSILSSYLKPDRIITLESDRAYIIDEVPVQALTSHRKSDSSLMKNLYIPLYACKVSRTVKRHDVILSFLERANFVNILLKLFMGTRAVITERTTPSVAYQRGLRRLKKAMIRFFYPLADMIVVNSEGVREDIENLCQVRKGKVKVIYNSYNIDEIKELSRRDPGPKYQSLFSSPVIINVGNLVSAKGHWHLIRIFSRVKKEIPDVKLVILGEGKLRFYLLDLAGNLGLKVYTVWNSKQEDPAGEDVYFLGFKSNPFAFLSRAKLFVFPSLREGFPNALLEAMACGLPVISSDCRSGPREILSRETQYKTKIRVDRFSEYGILMPMCDGKNYSARDELTGVEKLWSEVVIRMLRDSKSCQEYAKRSLKRANAFDASTIKKHWKDLINEVLNQ